jgi:hypothetical protein
MLRHREGVFPGYTPEGFAASFGQPFEILRREQVADSSRQLYLMRWKEERWNENWRRGEAGTEE